MSPATAIFLANLVLALHVGVAAFVVLGLVLIVGGNLIRWHWVNHLWFRLVHLFAIAVVVAEAWSGIACPLTLLEMRLRSAAGTNTYVGGFVEHWLSSLLYYQAPPWVFVVVYSIFALLVVASWWYFPPKPKPRPKRSLGESVA